MGKLLLPLLAAFLSLALPLRLAQAEETPVYIALGDSLAAGVGASDPVAKGYVGLTFQALRASDRYRERGLVLLNLGVPGATSANLLAPRGQLEMALAEITRRHADASSPDGDVEIISIDIGGNDLLQLAGGGSACAADPLGQACQEQFVQMLTTLETNLTQVVQSLREAAPNADIIIVGLYNPYSGTGATLEVTADFAIQQINGLYRRVAARPDLGAKMAEVFEFFRGRGSQWIASDGLHPNEKGHAVIAESLLAAIQSREPAIPAELLEPTPLDTVNLAPPRLPSPLIGAVESPAAVAAGDPNGASDNDTSVLIVLAIAIPAAFAAGAVVSGAFFLARGRP